MLTNSRFDRRRSLALLGLVTCAACALLGLPETLGAIAMRSPPEIRMAIAVTIAFILTAPVAGLCFIVVRASWRAARNSR